MPSPEPVNVLIVDDDRAMQRLLADVLTRDGIAVTLERDGEWALKAFEKKRYDAVLLDLLLPGMNGYEVARRIRELPQGAQVPLVMISGVYKNALHRKEALERYGATAFVEKPFRIAAIQEALKGAIGARYPGHRERVSAAEPPASESLAGDEAIQESTIVETAARSPASGQAIRGDLSRTAFPEVLAEIYRWKGTGALLLRREKVKKIVYFRDGVPQFIKSNILSECLGRVMVREGMISEADCAESLRRMKAAGRLQGTVLIDMGCISPSNLGYALNLQLRAKLFDVFGWNGGEYAFDRKAALPAEAIGLELTPVQAIYEGVRHAYDADRLAAALGPVARQYVHPAADPICALQDAGLGEEEREFLRHVDGRKTVAELRALGILSPVDADRLVYAMRCARALELRSEPASSSAGPTIFAGADRPPPPPPRDTDPRLQMSPPPPDEITDVTQRVPRSPDGATDVIRRPPPPPEDVTGVTRRVPAPAGPDAARRISRPRPPAPAPAARIPADAPGSDELPEIPAEAAVVVDEPAAPPPLPKLSGNRHAEQDDSVMREWLAARVAAMRDMDYFELLGVSRTARPGEITSAYAALAREHHPDRVSASASAEVRELASEILALAAKAHDTLVDRKERERYERQLAEGRKPEEVGNKEVGRILSAEAKFQKGEELLRLGDFARAHGMFREAVELYPEEGEFHAYLGWSRYWMNTQDPRGLREALEALERGVSLNPKSEKAYLFSGHVHKAAGNKGVAQKHFERAIQVNPGCTEALRELSLLDWPGKGR